MSSTVEFDERQLKAARAKAWHQDGESVVTMDAARTWLNERGLVLFAPRALQLPCPAPSLVEATLGEAKAAPTAANTDVARGLVGRMVADGVALPLNLLGVPGDVPDFVVSAQVFSYVFTLRGDKAWKLPPATSGAVKVSPLGLRVFEVLTERGALTAVELAAELGREVTEAAILRSLSELWSQLRVIPLLTQGDGNIQWELTTRRFTKAIKAGANAGQPTALSALISLYLAQAQAATEEEITTFLSPLTARSRVREVVHALLGARQLETVVVDGKTLLHLPGSLATAVAAEPADEVDSEIAEPAIPPKPKKVGTGRISSFRTERKPEGEFRGKPVRTFAAKAGASGGFKRADGKGDRERRPFQKAGGARPTERQKFTKPWEEDRKPKPAPALSTPDGFTKYKRPAPEDRAPLGPREQAGLPEARRTYAKPAFGSKPALGAKKKFGAKPAFGGKPTFGDKPKFGAKPGGFAKKPGNFGAKPAGFVKKPNVGRGAEGAEQGEFKPRVAKSFGAGGGFSAKRPYTPRQEGAAPRPGGFAKRPYAPRAEGAGFAAKRPYRSKSAGTSFTPTSDTGERTFAKKPYKPRAADADKRPFTKAPWTPSESEAVPKRRAFKPRGEGAPGKSFGSKPSFGAVKKSSSTKRPSRRPEE